MLLLDIRGIYLDYDNWSGVRLQLEAQELYEYDKQKQSLVELLKHAGRSLERLEIMGEWHRVFDYDQDINQISNVKILTLTCDPMYSKFRGE